MNKIKKYTLNIVLMSGALLICGCATIKPVSYDKFRNETTYNSKLISTSVKSGRGYGKWADMRFSKVVSNSDNSCSYQIKVRTGNEGGGFLDFNEGDVGILLLDGQKRINLLSPAGSKEHGIGVGLLLPNYNETVTFTDIDQQAMEDIVRARNIEYSIKWNSGVLEGIVRQSGMQEVFDFGQKVVLH